MKRIVITGGTGYIGTHLIKRLSGVYHFVVLTRNPQRYVDSDVVTYQQWDGKQSIIPYLKDCYGIVNLIGENIGAKPWTEKQKQKILDSRVAAAKAIKMSVEECEVKPKVWLQASATGYYGQIGKSGVICDEGSLKTEGSFLADVCEAWEQPIKKIDVSIRKVIIRSGVVLSRDSLMMKQLLLPMMAGVAAVTGKGKNSLPWISLEDELSAIEFLLKSEYLSGVFNLVSPCDNTMTDLVQEVKKHKFSWITMYIPRWMLEVVFGKEKVKEVILTDQRVTPKALMNTVFEFKHPKLSQCIDWCFTKKK